MNTAIEILTTKLIEAQGMQASLEASAYCNSLRLAIQVLKKYQEKMDKEIEKQLLATE